MSINMNYAAILRKIKQVSSIDTETIPFISISKDYCPDCEFDTISRASTNPACFTCGGTGYVEAETTTNVKASVDRISGLETLYELGGKLQKGQVIITVHISELETHDYNALDFLSPTPPVDYFEVDGKRFKLASVTPERLNGTIYELTMELELPKEEVS